MITTFALLFATAAIPPSAEQYYAAAVEKMRAQRPVDDLTYRIAVESTGAKFYTGRKPNGHLSLWWGIGSRVKADPPMQAAYRSSDHLTAIDTPKGWGTTQMPIFDPTWSGIYDWIRYGFDGPPKNAKADETAQRPIEAPTIATVHAMGVAYYNVMDGGPAQCPDGAPGHRVHLSARENATAHPLTEAIIDASSGEFCSLSFGFVSSGIFSARGAMTLALTHEDRRVLVTGERIEFNVHALMIQFKHIVSNVTFSNFAFPASLPEAYFPH